MTREEALKLLNIQLYGSPEQIDKYGAYVHSRALRMAIKALEQQPCEDAISRQAAIDGLNSINGTSELDKAFEVIENLPPVNPQSQESEQEPVLDKIRAEIEEQVLESLSDGGDDWFAAEKVNECLEIIDKYKAESEP